MFLPAIWIMYQVKEGEFGPVALGGMTYWSGLWATAFLLIALAVTPVVIILRWGQPILIRRMLGITALVYTIAHIIIYFALRFWDFAHIGHEMLTRFSLNLAALSTLGLLVLGATSLDAAVERMGVQGWNRLHSIVYVTTALAVIHYLLSPDTYPDQYLVSGIFFWLMVWRVQHRRQRGTDPIALLLLALAACLFTASLEIAWTWIYHDDEPLWVLGNNFSLELGLSPAWKVLTLGILIAIAAAIRKLHVVNPTAFRTGVR
jgi:sulfoxide reductase heme-binding subunit YedZ